MSQFSEGLRFADWPTSPVPEHVYGTYAIWHNDLLIYVVTLAAATSNPLERRRDFEAGWNPIGGVS